MAWLQVPSEQLVVLFAASVLFVLLLGATLDDAFELFESGDGVGDVVSCQCFSLVFGEWLFVMAFRELAEFSQLLLHVVPYSVCGGQYGGRFYLSKSRRRRPCLLFLY